MKYLVLPLVIALLALTGCAHNYVMKLSNGLEVVTASKPQLKDGIYRFKDARGQPHAIAQSRVLQVEPASFAKQEMKAAKPTSTGGATGPKKRHWYLLWIA